jgi:hypothetical protein
MLDGSGTKFVADALEVGNPVLATIAEDADLYEFVRLKAGVDFLEDGVAEAVLGDGDDGVQGVGTGAQFAAAGRR